MRHYQVIDTGEHDWNARQAAEQSRMDRTHAAVALTLVMASLTLIFLGLASVAQSYELRRIRHMVEALTPRPITKTNVVNMYLDPVWVYRTNVVWKTNTVQ